MPYPSLLEVEFEWLVRLDSCLAEGPIWDDRRQVCWWVDIEAGHVHRIDRAGVDTVLDLMAPVGMVALSTDTRLVAALDTGLMILDPDSGQIIRLAEVEADNPQTRSNDGKVGADGAIWFGTMARDASPRAGKFYRIGADGAIEVILEEVSISNGLDWSSDGTMYYVDSGTRRIDVLERGNDGTSQRTTFARIPENEGLPDGLCVDVEDNVWLALHGGGRLRVFDSIGNVIEDIPVLGDLVTSCTFGGADLQDLYVTVASGPEPGGILRGRARIRGIAPHRIALRPAVDTGGEGNNL